MPLRLKPAQQIEGVFDAKIDGDPVQRSIATRPRHGIGILITGGYGKTAASQGQREASVIAEGIEGGCRSAGALREEAFSIVGGLRVVVLLVEKAAGLAVMQEVGLHLAASVVKAGQRRDRASIERRCPARGALTSAAVRSSRRIPARAAATRHRGHCRHRGTPPRSPPGDGAEARQCVPCEHPSPRSPSAPPQHRHSDR